MLSLFVAAPVQTPQVLAAAGVYRRLLGSASRHLHFSTIPGSGGMERFSVSASGGEVRVGGSTAIAMCRGGYDYLKRFCHCQVSWSGDNLKLPLRLPDAGEYTVTCPNRYRHYFNVCTFGYTTVWWDWKRWQHEIDWMAVHGINMPLAMNGQEKVWQQVFREFGESDAAIQAHFTGPAFLPWHRMGNVDHHMSPLPQSWIDGQAELQKKILASERSLGMKPVAPGFSGFVPVDFDKLHPDIKLSSPSAWAGFAPTKFVDPRNPMFVKLGRAFVTDYIKEFGTDHLYLCDTFNEQNPQFPPETEIQDLRATGKAVFDSIHDSDPDGIWVTQGWLFYNGHDYWKPEKTAAYLSAVSPGHLIVLDLATNEHAIWSEQPAVKQAGWIYNTLHNYGQTTNLFGDLIGYAKTASDTLNDPGHGNMLGMGLTPEGIDQNPVVYELMTDLMWRTDPVDVPEWLHGYAESRYGVTSPEVDQAWKLLLKTLYANGNGWYRDSWRTRPSGGAQLPPYNLAEIRDASKLLLSQSPKLGSNTLYRRDLVDVTKTWVGGLADLEAMLAGSLYGEDPKAYEVHRKRFFELLDALDRLMATRPEHRMSSWIAAARAWGSTPAEKDHMERNARMQVTVWGGPELYDYANKEWAGLNKDFIQPRWKAFFDHLGKTGDVDYLKLETDWAMSTGPIAESKPEDSVRVVQELFARYGSDSFDPDKVLAVDPDPGIAVGKPVTDSGGTEGDHVPALAVDGHITGGYWSASPAPQWFRIDLQSVHQVNGVWLFPYYGDGRYYTYKVEGSLDGQTWNMLVDASSNTRPSSYRGYRHQFPSSSARYIRVTMLSNSANIGVHLYEVRVYEGK